MNNITDKQRIERLEILVMNLSNIVNKMQTGKILKRILMLEQNFY